jgi:hypothetical protein
MMEPLALMVTVLIAAGAVIFVAQPFLRPPQRRELEPQALSPHLARLERRDRALAALKELEFDHRTGAVSDDDYRRLLRPLRREAAEAFQFLERADAGASS